MPALPELVIEKSDGSTRDTLDLISASKVESLIEMWVGYAVVDRSAWLDVKPNVSERTDTFIIEEGDGSTFWAGRYAEDSRDGDTVTLTIESFERDARDYEPTDGKIVEQNVADDYVARTYGIDPVPTLSQGVIETGASSVSFSFAYAERAKVIRDAAEPAGMDVAYQTDRSVDFVNRLGSDKSGSITVSTTSQDIVDSLSVEDNYRDPVTHIRGLGAQQGNSQVTASATVSSYTTGERQVWRKYENKDIIQQDRLQSIVDRLASDFDNEERRITVEAKLVDVDVDLGDSITVDLPEDDINRTMRITRIEEVLDAARSKIVTLTNRDPSRGGDRKRRDDLSRFNSGDQGFVDRDNFRAVERQPVDATYNAQGNYFYPDDVLREDRAEIFVQALPYRSYVSAAGHSHDVTVTHPSHSHDVTHPSHSHDVTVTHPSHSHSVSDTSTANSDYTQADNATSSLGVTNITDGFWTDVATVSASSASRSYSLVVASVSNNQSSSPSNIGVKMRVFNNSNNEIYPNSDGHFAPIPSNATGTFAVLIPGNTAGDNIDIQLRTDTTTDYPVAHTATTQATSTHTHDISDTSTAALGTNETSTSSTELGTNETSTTALGTNETSTTDSKAGFDPGLNEYTNETASGVDLIINGTEVATNIGTGEFTTTVDVSGEFVAGNNTIELTSDSLGFISGTVISELFRSGAP